MRSNLKFIAIATCMLISFASCNTQRKTQGSHIEIKQVNGKYSFYVNGKPFEIKGVGGSNNLALLHKSGGNSFRTWGANNGKQLLDTAKKYNLMVAMGLGMGQELHHFDYNDTAAVAVQFNRIKLVVDSLKNHPNLLCWVAGNELNLNTNDIPVNTKVYDALKDIVDYIHKTDPNHPVTTTFAGISKEHVQVALEHCPELDFLSLQVYADLERLPELVKAAGITKPYAITEFGPRGHWEGPKTEWGREIEEASGVKATAVMNRIQKGIVSDTSGLCLGGYAFIWGQKQERTPTWYGMFLKSGEAGPVVDELTRYWSGAYPENRAPQVDSLKINNKNAVDNIYLKPGAQYTAEVFTTDPNTDLLSFKWVLLKEVAERSQGGAREIEPDSIQLNIISDSESRLTFIAPKEEGEYRLFSYVFDGKGKAGYANVPFFVKK